MDGWTHEGMKRKEKSRPVDEQKEREAKSALGDHRVLVVVYIGVKGGDAH
jgi:hypothetical protein